MIRVFVKDLQGSCDSYDAGLFAPEHIDGLLSVLRKTEFYGEGDTDPCIPAEVTAQIVLDGGLCFLEVMVDKGSE